MLSHILQELIQTFSRGSTLLRIKIIPIIILLQKSCKDPIIYRIKLNSKMACNPFIIWLLDIFPTSPPTPSHTYPTVHPHSGSFHMLFLLPRTPSPLLLLKTTRRPPVLHHFLCYLQTQIGYDPVLFNHDFPSTRHSFLCVPKLLGQVKFDWSEEDCKLQLK